MEDLYSRTMEFGSLLEELEDVERRLMQFGTWRSKKKVPAERAKVFKFLLHWFNDPDEEIADPEKEARKVEDILFRDAKSLNEYKDKGSIKSRLRKLYKTELLVAKMKAPDDRLAGLAQLSNVNEEAVAAVLGDVAKAADKLVKVAQKNLENIASKEKTKVRRPVDLSGDNEFEEDRFDLHTALGIDADQGGARTPATSPALRLPRSQVLRSESFLDNIKRHYL